MQYRIDNDALLNTLSIWNGYLRKKVHLIACGGTAITLMNLKESTRDIDFIIPKEKEYKYLVNILLPTYKSNINPLSFCHPVPVVIL